VKTSFLFYLILLSFFLASCNQQGQKKEIQTPASLKTAIEGELIANAKYWEYADSALAHDLPEIAAMFHATSLSEKAHADRQITMLLAHGGHLGNFVPEYAPYNLRENLETAIRIEHYEAVDQYPRFIAISDDENFPDVSETFTWALKAEMKHRDMFKLALASLDDPSIELPQAYMVCPRCGNTMDAKDYSDPCDICGNEASKFIEVK
jgi:rubrerythrin